MQLATTIEAKLTERENVQEQNAPRPDKGKHWTTKPRYTLHELLHDTEEASDVRPDDDVETPESLRDLPAALLD